MNDIWLPLHFGVFTFLVLAYESPIAKTEILNFHMPIPVLWRKYLLYKCLLGLLISPWLALTIDLTQNYSGRESKCVDQIGLSVYLWIVVLLVNWCKSNQHFVGNVFFRQLVLDCIRKLPEHKPAWQSTSPRGFCHTSLAVKWVPWSERILSRVASTPAFKSLP